MTGLIQILQTFLNFKNWSPPKKLLESICSSSLLTMIENTFRGGTLLDISKESELAFSLLKLVDVMANHKSLIPCLLPLDKHY